MTSPAPGSQVVISRVCFSIHMTMTYRNAIVHACPTVLYQVTQSPFPTIPQSIPDLCFPNLNTLSLVLMQLCSLHGSGTTVSLCNSIKISREEPAGFPFTKRGVILRAQEDTVSREGGTFQTEKHCKEIGHRAKMCSSRQNRQEACRQGGSAVLAASLSKSCFFPHHQPLFFCLSLPILPFPTPYFPLQCPFFCCFLFPVSSFPLKLTLPVKALHGNSISSAAFIHLFWLLCVTLLYIVLLQEIQMTLGQGRPGATFNPVPCATGPLCLLIFF